MCRVYRPVWVRWVLRVQLRLFSVTEGLGFRPMVDIIAFINSSSLSNLVAWEPAFSLVSL
jgi:hypothetical protein